MRSICDSQRSTRYFRDVNQVEKKFISLNQKDEPGRSPSNKARCENAKEKICRVLK
ncbi:hypothetical protein KIN20_007234 [Parelaphostrongylus tenuis]|uniref:Uncharacterized protein n=1 Tax=Parelaphostrongylus tenuis TaxID=148309 RepID=A0AAD5M323_PARTN|nr:hypothetical protein KIN20_007234 [Parelaphostrongylus tenuis]